MGFADLVRGIQTLIENMNTIEKGKWENNFTRKAVKYLESFSCGNIAVSGLTKKWLEDFQEYMLK